MVAAGTLVEQGVTEVKQAGGRVELEASKGVVAKVDLVEGVQEEEVKEGAERAVA